MLMNSIRSLIFLLLVCFFVKIRSSVDPFHYKGIGFIENGQQNFECIVVTSSSPVAASCLNIETGDVKWQVPFRKKGSILRFESLDKISLFLFVDETGATFLSLVFTANGGLLWELPLSLTVPLHSRIFYHPNAPNLIAIILDEEVHMIENAVSSQPTIHTTAFHGAELSTCQFHPVVASSPDPTQLSIVGCTSLDSGVSSHLVYFSDLKIVKLQKSNKSLPILKSSILSSYVNVELMFNSKVKAKSSVELSHPQFIIESSDFFYFDQDDILIPLLYIKIQAKDGNGRPLHLVFQGNIQDNKYEVVEFAQYGNFQFIKSFDHTGSNRVFDFYFVETLSSGSNISEAIVLKSQLNDQIKLYQLSFPSAVTHQVASNIRIHNLFIKDPVAKSGILVILPNQLVFNFQLNDNYNENSARWVRNDGFSHLEQPFVLHSAYMHNILTDSFAGRSPVSFTEALKLFTSTSQFANCDLSRSLLAFSRDPKKRSFSAAGVVVHLIALKPKFCGNVRVRSWQPILSNQEEDFVIDSVYLQPHWEKPTQATSSRYFSTGFTLIIQAVDQRTFIWKYSFQEEQSNVIEYAWNSLSFENRLLAIRPTSEVQLQKPLISTLVLGDDLTLLIGNTADDHRLVSLNNQNQLTQPSNTHWNDYFYSINKSSGALLIEKTEPSLTIEDSLRTIPAAKLQFDPNLEEIVLFLRPNHQTNFNNRATTLGDDNILLNYINPNIAVVCTKSIQRQQRGAKGSDDSEANLYINILDIVSGKVLHRVTQENVEFPFRGLIIENFVLVSYWNSKAKRGEITSIGLYDGFISKNDFTPFGTEGKAAKSEDHLNFYKVGNVTQRSSFFTTAPLLMQRTYAFTRGIADVTQTISSKGINNKNIIVAFDSGQLATIDFRALSPRRPLSDPTQSEREEGLVKYNPFIPMMPPSILTRYKHIAFGQTLTLFSTSAHLESESIVVALGESGDIYIDVFTPAQAFDSLAQDFNYLALCALLLGLLVAVLLLRHFNRRTTLHRLWH